jgi:hypothetical protein
VPVKNTWVDNNDEQYTADDANAVANALNAATAAIAQFDNTILPVVSNAVSPTSYISGQYYCCNSAAATSTSAALGNGSLRLSRWDVTAAITITRLWAEVTTVGEAGSKFRIGIWNDDGTGKPGNLLLDAGQIAGDSATVQELTVSRTLAAGTYWVGGAVQSAPSTQPTMRCVNTSQVQHHFPLGTSLPVANLAVVCWFLGSQTGAFGNFSGTSIAAAAARIGFKVA